MLASSAHRARGATALRHTAESLHGQCLPLPQCCTCDTGPGCRPSCSFAPWKLWHFILLCVMLLRLLELFVPGVVDADALGLRGLSGFLPFHVKREEGKTRKERIEEEEEEEEEGLFKANAGGGGGGNLY